VDAGDFSVIWEIEAGWPRNGGTVPRDRRDFSWSPVPGATSYGLYLDRAAEVRLPGPRWNLAAGDTLAPGPHVWLVYAYADAEMVGTFGNMAEFAVTE
jgi:hypothetical protein